MLEALSGLNPEHMPAIDQNSTEWRQTYFLRRSTRTLEEVWGAIETLSCKAEFKKLLRKQSPSDRALLEKVKRDMDSARSLAQASERKSAQFGLMPTLEKYRWRNVESFAQFLYVGFVDVTFLMQHLGYDAFRAKDW